MSKAKTKKTAAHRKADLDVARLEAGLAWALKVNGELHAQIAEERKAAKAEADLLRDEFHKKAARLCVDCSVLQASNNYLKQQHIKLMLASAK